MVGMDAWDMALLALASYVAIMALVRMMHRRKDAIVDELTEQIDAQRERLRVEQKKERRRKLRDQAKQLRDQEREAA